MSKSYAVISDAALGSLAGMALTLIGRLVVKAADVTYKPPGIAEQVTVEVDLVPQVILVAALVFICLAVVSAAIPARRAARQNIIDALGHV